ncbi:MAG: GvpL/GvpF family gas vesicle protein [Gemmatimonadota bacterium]
MPRSFSGRYNAIGEGLLLHGVTPVGGLPRVPGVDVVTLRDLQALVRQVPWRRVDATTDAIEQHRQVVEAVHQDRPVVPAPFGTVFRSRDSLQRWMEVHYLALIDALGFVRGRTSARVRMTPVGGVPTAEFENTVLDSLSFLRRTAVATVTPPADLQSRTAEASFLVERQKWDAFLAAIREERDRLPNMEIVSSGPWPPYDFVRLEFGG